MNTCKWIVFLAVILLAAPVSANMYKYVDENGNTVFTDDYSKVPEDQREDTESMPTYEPKEAPSTEEAVPKENDDQKPSQAQPAEKAKNKFEGQEQLFETRKALKAELEAIQKEKAALEKKGRAATKKEVDSFNEKVQQYEEKRKAFDAQVEIHNRKVAEQLKKREEERKQKESQKE